MRRLPWFIGAVVASLLVGFWAVRGDGFTGTLVMGDAEAQSVGNGPCGLSLPAFCDTFDQPSGIGNRSGQLNGTVWGVSRLIGAANLGQAQFNAASPTQLQGCNGTLPAVLPPNDVIICNGQLREATNDNAAVTALAMYPKQPFDFAGRTGIVTFDVSNDQPGVHTVWPEFWMSDQPVPVPFTHFGSLLSVPRNGFGIRFAAGGCGGSASHWTADSAIVVRNYVPDGSKGPGEKPIAGAVALQSLGCVTNSNGMAGSLNHVEIHVSQNQLDVYATDAGTTAPLKHIAVVPNVNLSFTRGLIWIEDVHYNAHKFGGAAEHTFAWDNVGFDGPAIAHDLTFDVPDNTQPVVGYPGTINLGWGAGPGTGPTLSIPGVTNIQNATAALLTFHFFATADPSSVTYTLNGHSHTVKPAFAPGLDTNGGFSPISFAEPVPLNEVVPGTNSVTISTNLPGVVSNVDLVLVAAGGGGCVCPLATFTPTPPSSASPTSVATVTATATPTPAAGGGAGGAFATGTPSSEPYTSATATPTRESHIATATPTRESHVATPTPRSESRTATPTAAPESGDSSIDGLASRLITNAQVSSPRVLPGSTETIRASIISPVARHLGIDIEVFDPSGHQVFQRWLDNQEVVAGETTSYAVTWAVPSTAQRTTYTVVIGVFTPGGKTKLVWNEHAAQFSVVR
jgi:hypothetical protein